MRDGVIRSATCSVKAVKAAEDGYWEGTMQDRESIKELIFTSPGWTIATMLAGFTGVALLAKPIMAVILSVYALIIGIFFPSVDLESMTRLIGHLSK